MDYLSQESFRYLCQTLKQNEITFLKDVVLEWIYKSSHPIMPHADVLSCALGVVSRVPFGIAGQCTPGPLASVADVQSKAFPLATQI